MINYIIPLIAAFFSGNMAAYFFIPVLCLAFVATVPCIIRQIIRWR